MERSVGVYEVHVFFSKSLQNEGKRRNSPVSEQDQTPTNIAVQEDHHHERLLTVSRRENK